MAARASDAELSKTDTQYVTALPCCGSDGASTAKRRGSPLPIGKPVACGNEQHTTVCEVSVSSGLTKVFIAEPVSEVAVADIVARVAADTPVVATSSTSTKNSTWKNR